MKTRKLPAYCLHKATGQAYVTLRTGGRRRVVYLGIHNSSESLAEYDRVVGLWLAGGPESKRPTAPAAPKITDLAARYRSQPSRRPDPVKASMALLEELYSAFPLVEFDGRMMERVRALLCERYSRKYAQECLDQTVEAFRRALIWDMISADTLTKVEAAARRIRADEAPTKTVLPVADDVVEATLPHLPKTLADAVCFIRLTGCRPGEAVGPKCLRVGDIDHNTWIANLPQHKNQHRGKLRFLVIPPAARELILARLARPADAYVFSPDPDGGRAYERRALGRAIDRAVRKANQGRQKIGEEQLPHWHPYQLRHTRAGEVREQFDAETAQIMLGNSTISVMQHYARLSAAKARQLAEKLG